MTEPIPKELALAAAKKLSPGSWEFLLDQLLSDSEVEPDPEIEAAWLAEVERRLREADESSWIPGEVVMAETRRTLNRPSKPRPPIVVDGVAIPVQDVIEACCELPIAERVALAEWYLSRERSSGRKRHSTIWQEDSTRWLARVRARL
ncbi:MAG: addiction module protein [Deltaproteobacteria bacterium]|nr:addiction module protein [Deltaproteobacteria bacterium]